MINFFEQPVAMSEARLRAHIQTLKLGAELDVEPKSEQESDRSLEIVNGSAILPVEGYIGASMSPFERFVFGGTDLGELRSIVKQADADSDVSRIVLRVNSGGGSVEGLQETMRTIRSSQKPVYSFIEGTGASAAYFLASQSREVHASLSASVGSLGVIYALSSYPDENRRVFRNREASLKNPGFRGEEISDEQAEEIQREIQAVFDNLRGEMDRQRPLSGNALNGSTFFGDAAKKAGLIDGLHLDFEGFLSSLN